MKKRIFVLLIACFILPILILCLPSCSILCNHNWVEATCTMPRHCSKCGELEGENLGHVWMDATLDAPKTCSRCGATIGKKLPTVQEQEWNALQAVLSSYTVETPYSDLYALYKDFLAYGEKYSCRVTIDLLLKYMVHGRWENQDGFFMQFTLFYKDYNETDASTIYGTNLKTSKEDNITYAAYVDYLTENDMTKGIVIGYLNMENQDQTLNFDILFFEDYIKVHSRINNEDYILNLNKTFEKVTRGNSKYAYKCLTMTLPTLFSADGVTVTVQACRVEEVNDEESETKPIEQQKENENEENKSNTPTGDKDNTSLVEGALLKVYAKVTGYDKQTREQKSGWYVIWEENGFFYIEEVEEGKTYSTNVDIDELNHLLGDFFS